MRGVIARLDHLGGDPEVGGVGGGDRHRHAAGQADARRVGHEARLVVDHLVAGVDGRPQRGVHALRRADRDHQLGARVVGHAVTRLEVVGDQLAQLDHPAVGGVVRLARLQAGDGGPRDRLRAW